MKSPWGRVAVAHSLVLAYGSGCTSGSDAPSDRLPGAELTPVRTLALEGNGNPLLLAVDDLAVDLAGNLFVLDGKTGQIHKYGPNGDYLASVSGPDGEAAGFRQPSGTGAGSIAFGQDQHLYVAGVVSETVAFDPANPAAAVARVSPDLTVDTLFTVEGPYFLVQLQAWEDKLVAVLMRPRGPGNEVAVYDYGGGAVASFHPRDERMDGVPYWSGWFMTHVAPAGDELVVANSLYPIHRYDADGASTGTFGGPSASFRLPSRPERFAFAGPEGRAQHDEWLKSFTTIDGVHVLDDSLVVIVLKDLNDEETALPEPRYRADVFNLGSGRLVARDVSLDGRVVESDTLLYVATRNAEDGWQLGIFDLVVGRSEHVGPASDHPVVSLQLDDAELWSLDEGSGYELDEETVGFLDELAGAVFASEGRAVAADRGNRRILVLDALGRLERTVGRRGEGPMEFQRISLLRSWPGDSVFVYDSDIPRFTVFSPETGEGRTVELEGMFPPIAALPGPVANELWLVEGFHIWPGKYPAGRRRLPLSVVRWRAEGDEIVPVADSVSGSDYYFGPRGVGFGKPPVSEVTSIAAGAGFLFVSEGAPSVRFMDAEGATRMEVAVEGTGVELGGNVRHRVTDSLYALEAINPVRMEKRLESAPLPERADGFDVVVFARDSTLWLGGRGIPGIEHRAWINVDLDGAPLRRLRLPRSLLVMDAEGDRLLLRRRDDMGLHHVEVRRAISP